MSGLTASDSFNERRFERLPDFPLLNLPIHELLELVR